MKTLDLSAMAAIEAGSRNCGNWWQTRAIIGMCSLGGSLIGLAAGGVGSGVGGLLGNMACSWLCYYAC